MFWADRVAGEIEVRYGKGQKSIIIRDEKTVSGRVHMGSMRGVAIHGVVAEALGGQKVPNTLIWEHNDFDPMDDIPVYLDRGTYEEHLGKPLCAIPSPDPSAKNYGEYFAKEFQTVIEETGYHPQFVWTSALYRSGKMDGVIREALEGADAIRRILKEVSGAERKEGWLPVSMICPTCGKMTTTEAIEFDGNTVQVTCLEKKVEYAKGCGWSGRLSPFGGNGKLYWKVDWPAKWKAYAVSVEGAGKDHTTKGGSRDVGNHIAQEVFHHEPPFDIPYEFLLIGGKKMSSSKGRGSSAREIADLMPPKILRLALIGKDINQAFNFDPEGDSIPILYDQYDKLAAGYWAGVEDDYARLFTFIHPGRVIPAQMFLMRFSQVAFIVQMPHMDLKKEAQALKGEALTPQEVQELDERARYAKRWLEKYAPQKYVYQLQEKMPMIELTPEQKQVLAELLAFLESRTSANAEEIHAKLHELKEFKAVYLTFLGRDSGPKAGWFLAGLDREFVLRRLKEAAA